MPTSNKSKSSVNDPIFESLSALVDGEASELELRRLLKTGGSEVEKRWRCYQLTSSVLKNDMKGFSDLAVSPDLYAKISSAIADESALSVETKSKSSSTWINIVRFGIAASVAGAVMVAIQLAPTGDNLSSIADAPVSQNPNSPGPLLAPDTSVQPVGLGDINGPKEQKQPIILNEATEQQLEQMKSEASRLMLEHAQNASQHTQQGVLPYVRVPEAE
ncbi:MAG: sigma-E factor negative regulatory protein RseA [Cellvibrionaceae bacterium]|jgi:sigma-E factor negative regulatory protein RseA